MLDFYYTIRKEIYTRVVIRSSDGMGQFGTKNHNTIYEYMLTKGCNHSVATNVADWAENASVGEKYKLDGFEIYVVD